MIIGGGWMTDSYLNTQALLRHMKDAEKITFRMNGHMANDLRKEADRKSQPVATVIRTAIYEHLYGDMVKE